jgi:hypothetical protein
MEKKFSIYSFHLSWDQEGLDYRNGTSWTRMYKVEPLEFELKNKLCSQLKMQQAKYKVKFTNIKMSYERKEKDTWCLSWFAHETFNKFKNDDDILESFENFVSRKISENIKNGHSREDRNDNSENPYYCLMGAQDSWRWEICKCDVCKNSNKIIIKH